MDPHRSTRLRRPLTQFTWSLPAGMGLDSPPVVSPEGRRIAFIAISDGTRTTPVRAIPDSREATAIPGTDGAKQPFWSPDGRSIGFFARGKLMKVTVSGGAPVEIADAPDGRGGAWSPSGTIVFGPNLIFAGLARVSAEGGPVEPATLIDSDRGENSHRWPVFLPDGIHFLFHVRASNDERRGVYVRAHRSAGRQTECTAVSLGVGSGIRGDLWSKKMAACCSPPPMAGCSHARFDAAALRVEGNPRSVAGGRGREHAVPRRDVERIGRPARDRGDLRAVRLSSRLGRTGRDGPAIVAAAAPELAAAFAGWAADGPANRRSGTGQPRCLDRKYPGRKRAARHHRPGH